MLSRVKTYENLYCIGEFNKSAIKVNRDALLAYERFKQSDLFSTIKRNAHSNDTLQIHVHNARPLLKHVDGIVNCDRIINNYIIVSTEIQINLSGFTYKIIETLKFFNIDFNSFLTNVPVM